MLSCILAVLFLNSDPQSYRLLQIITNVCLIFFPVGISLFLYCRTRAFIVKSFDSELLKGMKFRLGKLTLYPLALFFMNVPASLIIVFEILDFGIDGIVHIFYLSGGIVNMLLYLYVRDVKGVE